MGMATPITSSFLLSINRLGIHKKQIATTKILKYHSGLDMQTLFEWDFKVLPYMIEWFGRAAGCPYDANWLKKTLIKRSYQQSTKIRPLNAFPKFIEARVMHELKEATARKKSLHRVYLKKQSSSKAPLDKKPLRTYIQVTSVGCFRKEEVKQ